MQRLRETRCLFFRTHTLTFLPGGSHNFWVASVWGSLNYHGIPLRTPLRLPLIHSYQTCFSSLLICSSSHVSQVTAALLSDGPTASPMKSDSYKGWISCKRIFIRKKIPLYFALLCGASHILSGEIRAALCDQPWAERPTGSLAMLGDGEASLCPL